MSEIDRSRNQAALVVRWLARIWASGLLLFWGSFFIAHVSEWFVVPKEWPPLNVVMLCGIHLALLVGLIIGWCWELPGGIVVLVAAALFFPRAAANAALFLLVTVPPALLWIALGSSKARRSSLHA